MNTENTFSVKFWVTCIKNIYLILHNNNLFNRTQLHKKINLVYVIKNKLI